MEEWNVYPTFLIEQYTARRDARRTELARQRTMNESLAT